MPPSANREATQQDERVGAGTSAGDMTMVMHVPGRDRRRHITADKGALVRKAQLGPAFPMANRVPLLVIPAARSGVRSAQRR